LENKDFNSIFWQIFGVNQRVYEPLDVFKIKRDKQADLQKYNRFVSNPDTLSNKAYFEYLFLEVKNFDMLFINYFFGNTKQGLFYINQLHNITLNYKILISNDLKRINLVNLFAFQVALIIENMVFQKIDTKLFDQALQKSSLSPFLDRCKKSEKVKSFKDLAVEFSHIYASFQEKIPDNIIFEDIHPDTFQKELSLWNKGRTLPSLIKMLVIAKSAVKNKTKEKKAGIFLQLLLIRGLLYIQTEFDLNDGVKVKFLKQLENFRTQIKEHYLQNREDKIFKKQTMYAIDFSATFEDDDPEKIYQQLKPKIDEFAKHNDEKIIIGELITDRELLINEFNQCKSKDQYIRLLEKISFLQDNKPCFNYTNNMYCFIKFIISIKTEDKKLFNEQLKFLDRNFGGLLYQYSFNQSLSKYISVLENKSDLVECIECIGNYFKNCQQ
jgi:nucleoside diphosphate kinase